MKITCPHCNKKYALAEATRDENLRAIIKMQPIFGKHARLVFEYVEQFGVSPLTIKTRKIRRLLEVMARLFEQGTYSHQKKIYRISPAGIAEALTIVCTRHLDGLENHNYLKKVMIGISEQEERERGKQAERDLRAKEKKLQAVETTDGPVPWGEVGPEDIKKFNRGRAS